MKSFMYKLKMLGKKNFFKAINIDHILKSMEKNGIDIAPNGCYGGGCGVCKIKILHGETQTLSMSKKYINEEEKTAGYVLACRAFPKSDIEFEFVGKPQCKTKEKKKYGFV